jgi:hypothetical protein
MKVSHSSGSITGSRFGQMCPASSMSSSAVSSSKSSDRSMMAKGGSSIPSDQSVSGTYCFMLAQGNFAIEIVSLKGGFKGMLGGDRRGNAGHRCEAYRTGDLSETENHRLHLVTRIARAVTRFEDSFLGAAFGVALLFGLVIAALSVGGW